MNRSVTVCLFVVALLVGCGGGGSGGGSSSGGGGSEFTTLFEDHFDVFPSAKWTLAGGSAVHDTVLGADAPGSMSLSGDASARAVASTFPVDGGLLVLLQVRIPDASIEGIGFAEPRPLITIESAEPGTGSASIEFLRWGCATAWSTGFRYRIKPGGGAPESFFDETIGCAATPDGRFVSFWFFVLTDGTSAWYRDGNRVVTSPALFGPGAVRLVVQGSSFNGTTNGLPSGNVQPPFWFDDVKVEKPN